MSFRIGTIRIPIVQPNLRVSRDRDYETVDIVNGKRITKLGNKGLLRISYNSFFPDVWGSYCDISSSSLKKPIKYCSQLESIRDNENYVRVIHTDEKINCMMKIVSFERGITNGAGDISYSIELEEYNKEATIKKIPEPTVSETTTTTTETTTTTTTVSAFSGTDLTGDKREEKVVYAQEYTVVSGDCLYAIARKFNMNWLDLYNDNKTLIGNNPNLIYAGQVLKVRGTATKVMKLNSSEYYQFKKSKGH